LVKKEEVDIPNIFSHLLDFQFYNPFVPVSAFGLQFSGQSFRKTTDFALGTDLHHNSDDNEFGVQAVQLSR
tara:strand:- start:552 stop:764 length:213 start_codon:yes stop_codon:yes gene_type:complete